MRKAVSVGFLMLVMLILSACSSESTSQPLSIQYSEELDTESVPTEVIPTSAPDSAECMSCHTDKDRLIDTAAPIEEAGESESKGVG
jgi:hypothetical protein